MLVSKKYIRCFLVPALLLTWQLATAQNVSCGGLSLPGDVTYDAEWVADPPEPGVPPIYMLHVQMTGSSVISMCILASDESQSFTNASLNDLVYSAIADELVRWEAARPDPMVATHPQTNMVWGIQKTGPAILFNAEAPVVTADASRIRVVLILDRNLITKTFGFEFNTSRAVYAGTTQAGATVKELWKARISTTLSAMGETNWWNRHASHQSPSTITAYFHGGAPGFILDSLSAIYSFSCAYLGNGRYICTPPTNDP